MAWSFTGMAPRDWVAALEVEVDTMLAASGRESEKRKDQHLIDWLNANHDFAKQQLRGDHLSSLRKDGRWDSSHFSGRSVQARILECIRANLLADSLFSFLVDMRLRVCGIYNPTISREVADELTGIFMAKRFSIASPGEVNISAFRFSRDHLNRPVFIEKRVVDNREEKPYRLRCVGSWHLERTAFLLSGITYKIPFDIEDEARMKLDSIDIAYEDRILLHHDGNEGFMRGLIASIVRRGNAPGVTEIVFDRLSIPSGFSEDRFWTEVEDQEFHHRDTVGEFDERLGVRPPRDGEEAYLKLREADPSYKFPLIHTRQI